MSDHIRILAVSDTWQGANDYAFVRAFRRAGHSVRVFSQQNFYVAGWQHRGLRALRRALTPLIVREFERALIAEAAIFQPDLLFVFKGDLVTAKAIRAIREMGAIAINFYPDTGFADFGPYLPKAIGKYDWVFTTKPAGVRDLVENYGSSKVSFVPHAFDPETHTPTELGEKDRAQYLCDISFIGSFSYKKAALIGHVLRNFPAKRLHIWGGGPWRQATDLTANYRGATITGLEYAKAIQASKINLGLLFEGGSSAPEPDKITARTFEIPAAGGFMLHERTDEALSYFEEGKEAVFFDGPDEMLDKITYYLNHKAERAAIAEAGRQRCVSSGYSVDDRVRTVLAKYAELRAG